MNLKNATLKEVELPNGKWIRANNVVELEPYGRVIVKGIILVGGVLMFDFQDSIGKNISHTYEYVVEKVKVIFDECHELKIVIGDWSEDGHEESEEFGLLSNYDVSKLRKAYKKSCKLTGLTFNHNEDYTGLLEGKYGSWRQLFTEYESCEIEPEACKILEEYGLIKKDDWDEENDGGICMPDPEDCADLIMRFIALSMPKDFVYSFADIGLQKATPINGYWNKELNVQFGYGLFD